MGVRFSLEHASLVGWLTRRDFAPPFVDFEHLWMDPWYRHRRMRHAEGRPAFSPPEWRAPRVDIRVLREFLEALPQSVATSRSEDHSLLWDLVGRSREELYTVDKYEVEKTVPSMDVARILAPLRGWFDVPFYFMPLGMNIPLERFTGSTDYTLWLQCDDDRRSSVSHDLLDPFPPLRQLFVAESYEPTTVCWTWTGESVVIRQETASVGELVSMVRGIPPPYLWTELKARGTPQRPAFNILHISDLHFGATAVTHRKLAYVEQHLRDCIDNVRSNGGVVQPVITGDLMDTPSKKNLEEFEAFRNRLTDHSKTDVICIPGNHDMRRKGFLWKNWEALAGLEWKSVVPSEVCKVIFACFDTSRDAKLAQGKIADDQFLDVTTKLTELRRRGDYSNYIILALVHHHPFSTREDEVDTVPFLGIREEPYLRMENGDQLVKWCASNGVPLILHGHKHRPRYIGQEIELNGRTRLVRAIGCGSSFGIEGKPLSFNWITWQPSTKQWAVSFYADPGDGSGFQEKRLAIGERPDAP